MDELLAALENRTSSSFDHHPSGSFVNHFQFIQDFLDVS